MWQSENVDRATATARLDEDGQLEPIAVDESLTTLLFAGRPASASRGFAPPVSPPVPEAERRDASRPVAALFEMV
jgi:hypothetical protein